MPTSKVAPGLKLLEVVMTPTLSVAEGSIHVAIDDTVLGPTSMSRSPGQFVMIGALTSGSAVEEKKVYMKCTFYLS